MGVYVCTASNGVLPAASRRIMVSIHFNPVVHVPNQLIWSTVGSNLTMECFVEASPRSMNFWVKGEGELILSSKKYTLSDVRDSIFAVRMSLTVHSFEKEDVGKYRCVAKNSLGEVEGRIHVYGTCNVTKEQMLRYQILIRINIQYEMELFQMIFLFLSVLLQKLKFSP